MLVSLKHVPWFLDEEFLDEVLGQVGAVLESLLVEGVVHGHDVLVGLLLRVPEEGREAGQHDVGDNADAPEICGPIRVSTAVT